jgi:hypothetical protein
MLGVGRKISCYEVLCSVSMSTLAMQIGLSISDWVTESEDMGKRDTEWVA